ncbi:MAG: hypothetical protein NZ534_00065 [Bacteroidia bacterium]|nr:hypothetical protein [Bacteroidia bacterium]
MSSGIAVAGIDITRFTTVQEFTLGARAGLDTTEGVKEFMYVSFPASTSFAAGDALLIHGSTFSVTQATTANTAPGQSAGRRVGFLQQALSSNPSVQFGWVQIYGRGLANVVGSTVLNTPLNTTTTAGRLDDDGTAGTRIIDGVVLPATSGGTAGASAAVFNYPFVGRTL